jgi:hypothetical protein
LRLDQKDSAFSRLESGSTAVVAGKPNESELVRRIHYPNSESVVSGHHRHWSIQQTLASPSCRNPFHKLTMRP